MRGSQDLPVPLSSSLRSSDASSSEPMALPSAICLRACSTSSTVGSSSRLRLSGRLAICSRMAGPPFVDLLFSSDWKCLYTSGGYPPGRVVADPEDVLQRWRRYNQSLLNSKSAKREPAILEQVARHPLSLSFNDDPTVEEVVRALRQVADGKAMGPEELPLRLLKLSLRGDREILAAVHELILSV